MYQEMFSQWIRLNEIETKTFTSSPVYSLHDQNNFASSSYFIISVFSLFNMEVILNLWDFSSAMALRQIVTKNIFLVLCLVLRLTTVHQIQGSWALQVVSYWIICVIKMWEQENFLLLFIGHPFGMELNMTLCRHFSLLSVNDIWFLGKKGKYFLLLFEFNIGFTIVRKL